MPKVAIVTLSEASAVRAALPIAKILKENNYLVEFVGFFDPGFESFIVKNGYVSKSFYEENAIENELLDRCFDYYKNDPPALVLFEPVIPQWVAPFVKLGCPLVAISCSLGFHYSASTPPVTSTYILKRSKVNDWLSIQWLWFKLYAGNVVSNVTMSLLKFITWFKHRKSLVDPLQELKRNGYKLLWGDYGQVRIDVPTIFLCPKELDFPANGMARRKIYAGASVDVTRVETDTKFEGLVNGKTNIYCTLGSLTVHWPEQSRRRFYSAMISAVENTEYHLVLQVSNKGDIDHITIPSNVSVHEWVPHNMIFKDISLVICHGGLGVVRESIFWGLPMLLFPMGGDQLGNAARAQYHNLGLLGNFYTVSGDEIKKMIDAALNDNVMRSSLRTMQHVFAEQSMFQGGIELLESFMKQKN